jgi:hypothetical protein
MAARSTHTPRRAETRDVPACRAPPRHRERAASWSSTAAAPRASSPPLDLLHPHLLPLLHPLVTRPSPFCLAVHTRLLHDPSRPATAAVAVRRHDPLPTPTCSYRAAQAADTFVAQPPASLLSPCSLRRPLPQHPPLSSTARSGHCGPQHRSASSRRECRVSSPSASTPAGLGRCSGR